MQVMVARDASRCLCHYAHASLPQPTYAEERASSLGQDEPCDHIESRWEVFLAFLWLGMTSFGGDLPPTGIPTLRWKSCLQS